MKALYVSLILSLLPLTLLGQKIPERLTLYSTTREFLNNNPMEVEAFGIVESFSPDYFRVKKIFDVDGKKVKRGLSAFTIKYNDKYYFNLGYSEDLNNWTYYARFDIVGRYCAIIIDDTTPAPIKNGGINYGLGVSGALMKDSAKWGKAWIDKDGKKRRILFIDTLKYVQGSLSRNGGSIGNYLTRQQLADILSTHKIDIQDRKARELSFEEVIEFVNQLNIMDKV